MGGLTIMGKVNATLGDTAACVIIDNHRQVEAMREDNCQSRL
jgi:hypothetical protein